MRRDRTIAPDWFEALYKNEGDPWGFETSPYERAKYDHTLASLPVGPIASALEVGCANGVLTERLAPSCGRLLGVDVSATALARARARCAAWPQVGFERRMLPAEMPPGPFDLILLSEMVYYLDRHDLAVLAGRLTAAMPSGGHLLLVHWLGETDYPLGGDEAVEGLRALLGDRIEPEVHERRERYRLDRWRRR